MTDLSVPVTKPTDPRFTDLTGKQFGKLKVVYYAGKPDGRRLTWGCLCECGNSTVVPTDKLKSGHTSSCGCKVKSSGGMYLTSEYLAWCSMRQRCLTKTHKQYPEYGGRGITICQSWLDSFNSFYEDMGPRPSDKHSIDRKDNDSGYSKGNCRWATAQQQNNNRRPHRNNTSGTVGVYWHVINKAWDVYIRVGRKQKYIGSFKGKQDAINARKEAEKEEVS